MEMLTHARQYVTPAVLSVLAIGLLKMGLFVTQADLAQSLRGLESAIRAEYATQQDIADIKALLNRLDGQLTRLDDRLRDLRPERR